jgi:3-phosphoshikimate 1-carboxyvinyltransferase
MKAIVNSSKISGSISIPSSKSHTIRAILIASLAEGTSTIINPLDSKDSRSCIESCLKLGAKITEIESPDPNFSRALEVQGIGAGAGKKLSGPYDVIDVGNSGTTLYLATGISAFSDEWTVFTGDHQIRNRPINNLLQAYIDLGAEAYTTRTKDAAPFVIRGPLKGGETTIACPTSQYLSSLLLACPLAENESIINISLLHEKPYAEITLRWLDEQGIKYERSNWDKFVIPGKQKYIAFQSLVPGDFSSACFPAVLAAISGATIELKGLDFSDSQGDKEVFSILESMGCSVEHGDTVTISGPLDGLLGGEFDLNAIPDALPALSVAALFAKEPVRLSNVPQARLKETDRIAVMHQELRKLGANVEELSDGLVIHPGNPLECTKVDGHHDHRVVMSLTLAGLVLPGTMEISTAEAAEVTFPNFFGTIRNLTNDPSSIVLE